MLTRRSRSTRRKQGRVPQRVQRIFVAWEDSKKEFHAKAQRRKVSGLCAFAPLRETLNSNGFQIGLGRSTIESYTRDKREAIHS